MKVALINASPRGNSSTSRFLLEQIKSCARDGCTFSEVGANRESFADDQLQVLREAEAWVFANPIYIDSLPGHLIPLLMQLEAGQFAGHKVYALVNCGFFESSHNRTAIRIYENWCKKSGNEWCGAAAIGGGGAIEHMHSVPFDKGPLSPVGKVLKRTADCIKSGSRMQNAFVSVGIPRFLYIICANYAWKKSAKHNGLKVKDLYRK